MASDMNLIGSVFAKIDHNQTIADSQNEYGLHSKYSNAIQEMFLDIKETKPDKKGLKDSDFINYSPGQKVRKQF